MQLYIEVTANGMFGIDPPKCVRQGRI